MVSLKVIIQHSHGGTGGSHRRLSELLGIIAIWNFSIIGYTK
jgi:hypothetical protein